MAYIISGRPDVMSMSNCFAGNDFSSASVDHIQMVLPCAGAAPGPFPSEAFKAFSIPGAPDYTTVVPEQQNQDQYPGKIKVFAKKLEKITKPDLSEVELPN